MRDTNVQGGIRVGSGLMPRNRPPPVGGVRRFSSPRRRASLLKPATLVAGRCWRTTTRGARSIARRPLAYWNSGLF